MKPQNRKLSLRMKGEDVQRLQAVLGHLGFPIADREGYFGKTTRQAVLAFQEQQNLEPTGIVDEETAELIEVAIAKPEECEGPEEQHRPISQPSTKANANTGDLQSLPDLARLERADWEALNRQEADDRSQKT